MELNILAVQVLRNNILFEIDMYKKMNIDTNYECSILEEIINLIDVDILEIEKLQIIDAVTFGNRQELYDGTETLGKKYYTQTFNTK